MKLNATIGYLIGIIVTVICYEFRYRRNLRKVLKQLIEIQEDLRNLMGRRSLK